jgi:hypothetical protein
MSLIQDVRGGRDNDPNFGSRMRGTGPVAQLIRSRFQVAHRRLGLDAIERVRLDTTLFRAPGIAGAQMNLGFWRRLSPGRIQIARATVFPTSGTAFVTRGQKIASRVSDLQRMKHQGAAPYAGRAKVTPFAGGNEVDVRKSAAGDFF